MNQKRIIYLTLIIGLLHFTCNSQKILFIGNSLTYTNNLPIILEEIGTIYSKKIDTEMVCHPNYAIIDHLNDGIIQQKIATENYDYVIIQQGPSSQEKGRKMLINDGKKIARLCSKYNSKLGYIMVWPSKRYYFTFDEVIKNHTEAAKRNNALLFPVGKYWKQYENRSHTIPLYGSDKFHPSNTGSFLAALTIYSTLYPTADLSLLTFKGTKKWMSNKKILKIITSIINDGYR
jgi:hypothetical protein